MIVYESNITTISSNDNIIITISIDDLPTGCEYFLPTGGWSYNNNPLDENDNVGYNLIFDEPKDDEIRAEMYNNGSNIIINITNRKDEDIDAKILLIYFDNVS